MRKVFGAVLGSVAVCAAVLTAVPAAVAQSPRVGANYRLVTGEASRGHDVPGLAVNPAECQPHRRGELQSGHAELRVPRQLRRRPDLDRRQADDQEQRRAPAVPDAGVRPELRLRRLRALQHRHRVRQRPERLHHVLGAPRPVQPAGVQHRRRQRRRRARRPLDRRRQDLRARRARGRRRRPGGRGRPRPRRLRAAPAARRAARSGHRRRGPAVPRVVALPHQGPRQLARAAEDAPAAAAIAGSSSRVPTTGVRPGATASWPARRTCAAPRLSARVSRAPPRRPAARTSRRASPRSR